MVIAIVVILILPLLAVGARRRRRGRSGQPGQMPAPLNSSSECSMNAKTVVCFFGVVLPLCVLPGCGAGCDVKVYPVEGKVLLAGSPAGCASVCFYPSDHSQQRIPVAITAADGTFRLTTIRTGDGAPVGDYDITVVWPDYSIPRDECADPLHDRLKLHYADRSKTELHATVVPGRNKLILHVSMEGGWSFPPQRSAQRRCNVATRVH